MNDIKFNCPFCKQKLEAPFDMARELIDCPSCKNRIKVSRPQTTPKAEIKPPPHHAAESRQPSPDRTSELDPDAKSNTLPLCIILGFIIAAAGIFYANNLWDSEQSIKAGQGEPVWRSPEAKSEETFERLALLARPDMEMAFSKIKMDPKIHLSRRAEALHLTVSFTGAGYKESQMALTNKNWGTFCTRGWAENILTSEDLQSLIFRRAWELKNKSFKLVVNIDPSLVPKEVPLICLTLPDLDDPDADSAWMNQADKRIFFYKSNHGNDSYDAISQKDDPRSWENHPDGTGIIRNWRLIDREVLLLVIDLQPADAKRIPQLSESPSEISFYLKNWPYQDSLIESVRQIDQTYSNSVSKLNQKQQLGELDDAGKTKQLRSLRIRKRDSYMALLERF